MVTIAMQGGNYSNIDGHMVSLDGRIVSLDGRIVQARWLHCHSNVIHSMVTDYIAYA